MGYIYQYQVLIIVLQLVTPIRSQCTGGNCRFGHDGWYYYSPPATQDDLWKVYDAINVLSEQIQETQRMLARISKPSCCEPCAAATSCAELFQRGVTNSGLYHLKQQFGDVTVYCDQETPGGGWQVVQRRQDGSVPFDRTWEEYEKGFGNPLGEFWIGNTLLHQITSQRPHRIHFDLEDSDGNKAYAILGHFEVGAAPEYRLNMTEPYEGDAINSTYNIQHGGVNPLLASHRRMRFSTKDKDQDTHEQYHCSTKNGGSGGWWFGSCHSINPNGKYLVPGMADENGVVWHYWHHDWSSLERIEMKIQPVDED